MSKRRALTCPSLAFLAAFGAACGDDAPLQDGAIPDGGTSDAATPDAATPDAATPDAGANRLPLRAERLLTGECPDGEVCDSRTTGAHYSGSWDFEGLAATAVGGVQYISLAVAGEAIPFSITSSDSDIATIAGTTQSEDELFAALLHVPLDTDFVQVHLSGVAAGSGFLELRSTDQDELIDRIKIRTGVPTMPFIEDPQSSFHPDIGRSRKFCVGTDPVVIDRELTITSGAEVRQDTLLFRCFFVADDTTGPIPITLTFAGVEYPLSIQQP